MLPQLANTGFAAGSADATQLDGYVSQVASSDPFAGLRRGHVLDRQGVRACRAGRPHGQPDRQHLRPRRPRRGDADPADGLDDGVPGETTRSFWYNPAWGTLIGYPASYGSDTDLNDHHFHYGYYVVGAATVAQFDPSWAADSAYGGMVNTVIKDAANWDRTDTRFPFLRDFDIYAGHDWAAGHGAFAAGNNQESSSEGMNFASGLIQWGQVTGNKAVRDLGIYLYTTQASAIENYWFDTDDEAFPAAFGHSTVGMVWGDGGSYSTWFSAEPEMIQGINLLPSTAGHLYLGYNPAYISRNIAELERNNGGPATVWQDIIWEFQALADAPTALAQFRSQAGSYAVEEGESRAHTFYWLKNLSGLGTVDRSVTANTPLHAVFVKNGVRTYQAANMSGSAITVTFSNGVTLAVPARSVASSNTTRAVRHDGTLDAGVPDGIGHDVDVDQPVLDGVDRQRGRHRVRGAPQRVGRRHRVGHHLHGLRPVAVDDVLVHGPGPRRGGQPLVEQHARVSVTTSGSRRRHDGTVDPVRPGRVGHHVVGDHPGLVGVHGQRGRHRVRGAARWHRHRLDREPDVHGDRPVASTAYTFTVRAYDAAGNRSAASSAVNVTTSAGSTGIDATSRIQAEACSGMAGVAKETTSDTDGGQNVGWIANGDHLRFDNVNFGSTERRTFSARVASGAAGGVSGLVNVRLDSLTGPSIGSFAIASTGGWQTLADDPGEHPAHDRHPHGLPDVRLGAAGRLHEHQLVHVQLADDRRGPAASRRCRAAARHVESRAMTWKTSSGWAGGSTVSSSAARTASAR